jgi:LacI family transcriptional regulator
LIEHGVEAADRLLGLPERPSVVFVTSDRKAIGVVHRLLERGVRVPEDIAVIGYDDIPYASCAQVPLTTVAVPKRPLGEMSADSCLTVWMGSRSKNLARSSCRPS